MFASRSALLRDLLEPYGGRSLLLAANHSAATARERRNLVILRARSMAALCSVLTLGWVAVDVLTVGWPLSGVLALLRVIAAGVFAVLALQRFSEDTAGGALWAVGGLIGTMMGLCLCANIAFWWLQSDQSVFATNTYLYAPFLIAASLGMFPLTALECALLSLPLIATMAVSAGLWSQLLPSVSVEATLWRLTLMAAIGSLSSMSQLQFLVRLVEQSARDVLTGALTRKVGEELLRAQFALARRRSRYLSVLFLDLDRFKEVNDRWGHAAGDDVLRNASRALQEHVRAQDIVIRWGGEEFVVVLPETDSAGAERVVQAIAKAGIGARPDGALQTASIGVAERSGDGADDCAALIQLADERMYAAKQAGRNRCVGPGGNVAPFVGSLPNLPPQTLQAATLKAVA